MYSSLSRRVIEAHKLKCILSDIRYQVKVSTRSISYVCRNSSPKNSWYQSPNLNARVNSYLNVANYSELGRSLLVAPKGPSIFRIQLEHTSPPQGDGRVKINVKTDKETVTLLGKDGDSILDIVNNNNYEIPGYGACDGTIACSTCHVVLSQKDYDGLNKRVTEEEKDLLDMVRDLKETSSGRCFGASQRCLTLAGCGFLAPYLLGAVICLARHRYWGLETDGTTQPPHPSRLKSVAGTTNRKHNSLHFHSACLQADETDREMKKRSSRLQETNEVNFEELKLSPLYVAGTSAGALLGAVIVAGSPSLQTVWDTFHEAARDCSRLRLGPFSSDFVMEKHIRNCIEKLPEDAHLRVSGRLFVSITHVSTFSNRIVSEWHSREDLIQCLLCSCYLPVFSGGRIPEFRGERFIDGGFTNNLPTPFEPILSISPFAGSSHICPHDLVMKRRYLKFANENFLLSRPNIRRVFRAFIPIEKEVFDELFLYGYLHSINYMKQKLDRSTK